MPGYVGEEESHGTVNPNCSLAIRDAFGGSFGGISEVTQERDVMRKYRASGNSA
jgi:hypothetical protein